MWPKWPNTSETSSAPPVVVSEKKLKNFTEPSRMPNTAATAKGLKPKSSNSSSFP